MWNKTREMRSSSSEISLRWLMRSITIIDYAAPYLAYINAVIIEYWLARLPLTGKISGSNRDLYLDKREFSSHSDLSPAARLKSHYCMQTAQALARTPRRNSLGHKQDHSWNVNQSVDRRLQSMKFLPCLLLSLLVTLLRSPCLYIEGLKSIFAGFSLNWSARRI